MNNNTQIFPIGKAAPRADARAKVTGREKYAADYYSENQFWAGADYRRQIAGNLLQRLWQINLSG